MGQKFKARESDKLIRFSIGAKLVTIISILIILSLGTITFLVSYFVTKDLELSAEENNFSVNRRASADTEYILSNVRSNSQVLIQMISSAGAGSALAKQSAEYFFDQNRQVAAIAYSLPGSGRQQLVNEKFFIRQDIDSFLVDSYYQMNASAYQRAVSGESVLLNATPLFNTQLLAMFFPLDKGGALSVLYAPDSLNNTFSSSLNVSFLINGEGDVLVHSDYDLVAAGSNVSNRSYVKAIRESAMNNKQELYTDNDIQYYVAYTKLNIGSAIAITTIQYDKIFEGIAATTRRNMYLTATVLFLSILFIWFFSKTISVALKTLASAARRIEGGFFDIELKPKGKDEITSLTISFQKMCSALNIFGRFTNREVAVKAMRGEIKPGGLPKHATIFFSDIRGFTEKSENFTKQFGEGASDRIIFWLNEYFTQMVNCVEKTNGVVDKFIGDAVMAHWGTAYTAGSPAKDAYNGVKAALMMRRALYFLNQKRKPGDAGSPEINIGCGINTGIVTAGQLGSDVRMEYTVIGDPVNLASRIEALNKPLGTDILISEDTYNLVKHFFITEEMPSVTVKGKEKPVRIFAVINHVAVNSGPKTLSEVRRLLNIKAPDISKVDINKEEKKYKIGAET
jgi:adenylate cyclase